MEYFHSDKFYFSHEVEGYIIHGNISTEMEMHNFMTGKDYVNNSKVFINQKGDNRKHNDMIKNNHKPKCIDLKQHENKFMGNPV